jgi:hypothetical protein
MLRGSILLVALLLAVAGCSRDDKQAATQATTAGGTTTTAPTTTTEPPATSTQAEPETRAYQTWFTQDGQLAPVWLEGEDTVGVLTQAILLLLTGPASEDVPGDVQTSIPTGTELINLNFAGGTATIQLSEEFAAADQLAVAQVVYTATQYATVRTVRIEAKGKTLTGELRRKDFADLLPPIVVETPTGLEPVKSPFTVAGSANVFEANVTIRILNDQGDEVFSDFTTATCGTGCRGRFKKTIAVAFAGMESGTLVVQDDDADGDGKPSFEVRIPLEFG